MSEGTVKLAIWALAVLGALSIIEIGALDFGGNGNINPVLAAVAGGAVTGIGSLITVSRTPPSKGE